MYWRPSSFLLLLLARRHDGIQQFLLSEPRGLGSAKKFLSSYARVKLRSVYEQYRRLMLRRPHELGFIRGIRIKHKKNYQHESVDTVHDHGRKDERLWKDSTDSEQGGGFGEEIRENMVDLWQASC